jgi:hypothetical protein
MSQTLLERAEYIRVQQLSLIEKQKEALDTLPELIKRWRSDARFLRANDPRPDTAALIASTYEGCAQALQIILDGHAARLP